MSKRPTNCPLCSDEFKDRPILQVEAQHIAAKHGESVARSFVDDALEEVHAEHEYGKNSAH